MSRRITMISAVAVDADTLVHARLGNQPRDPSGAGRPGRRRGRIAGAVDPAVDRDVPAMPELDCADGER
jgi:hypothetical protein